MSYVEFTFAVAAGSILGGLLGAVTGLGGGVVIVPMLTLLFGVDMRHAMGASLMAVIATSSGAAAAYVKDGLTNIRIGMFLELATTTGAFAGAWLTGMLPASILAVGLGCILIYSAATTHSAFTASDAGAADSLAAALRLSGELETSEGLVRYQAHHTLQGFAVMFMAGILSGLLGIGSGAVKVLGMDRVMRLPLRVSTTTSNFMIGVTAAASAGVYYRHGYLDPTLAMPVVLGTLAGSVVGARVLRHTRAEKLMVVFRSAVAMLGLEVIAEAFLGGVR